MAKVASQPASVREYQRFGVAKSSDSRLSKPVVKATRRRISHAPGNNHHSQPRTPHTANDCDSGCLVRRAMKAAPPIQHRPARTNVWKNSFVRSISATIRPSCSLAIVPPSADTVRCQSPELISVVAVARSPSTVCRFSETAADPSNKQTVAPVSRWFSRDGLFGPSMALPHQSPQVASCGSRRLPPAGFVGSTASPFFSRGRIH